MNWVAPPTATILPSGCTRRLETPPDCPDPTWVVTMPPAPKVVSRLPPRVYRARNHEKLLGPPPPLLAMPPATISPFSSARDRAVRARPVTVVTASPPLPNVGSRAPLGV